MMPRNFLQNWFLKRLKSSVARISLPSLIFPAIAFLFSCSVTASYGQQDEQPGNWIMYFGSFRLDNNWSLHSDIQYRAYDLTANTEQWLLRGGINYHIDKTSMITAGYALITNHHTAAGSKGVTSAEHRIWEQFLVRQNVGRFQMEYRLRLEQRWITGDQNRYLNRGRYLYRLTVPISNKVLDPNTFFVSFYDEIFLHIKNSPFDRNRLYGAFGYQFSKDAAVQVGYLLQTTATATKPYLQFGFTRNFDFRNRE